MTGDLRLRLKTGDEGIEILNSSSGVTGRQTRTKTYTRDCDNSGKNTRTLSISLALLHKTPSNFLAAFLSEAGTRLASFPCDSTSAFSGSASACISARSAAASSSAP